MLAYESGYPTTYEPVATAASLLVAIVITAAGFYLAARGNGWNLIGGAVIGGGIAVMHYTGMSAVVVPGTLEWDIPLVAASVTIGVILTSLALAFYHLDRGLRATGICALTMTLAICGLHFTAMAAVTITPDPTILVTPSTFDNSKLAIAVAGVTLLLLVSGLTGGLLETEARKQRKAARNELAQEVEERRRLFETSLDMILITNRQGDFVRVSPSVEETLGYTPEELIGRSGAEFVYPEDLEATRREMRQAREGNVTRNFETRYVHKQGRVVALSWSGVWSEPEQKHFFVGRDMTERKLAEEQLWQLAHLDQLTGLSNRLTLHSDLGELLATGPHPTGIALFDLDGFKDVNDTLGHSMGDRLLQEVAGRFREATQGCAARIYRVGGDEFAMVIPEAADANIVLHLIDAVLERVAGRFEINGHRVFVGASAGISFAPRDGSDVERLMSNADLALYDAKAAGGRTYRLFVPALREKAQARRALDNALRRAYAENEFVLHYQPQLRLSDGKVVGAEALLRWKHPERGLLAPGAFIEALTQSPVALDVGRWILRTACAHAADWRARGRSIRVGVNLFPAQFNEGTLLTDVETALQQTGLPPEALELEITENIALQHNEGILAPLRAIRALGVGLAFDDFGTGYGSLSCLTKFPLSRIKIDQSFVRKIGDRPSLEDTAIVRSIIVLASNLGLEVTAEGVELLAQAEFLRAEKCAEAQGFYYARPLPLREFGEFFANNNAPPHVLAS